jgi:transcriptional regulator with XRE-family HTH domain
MSANRLSWSQFFHIGTSLSICRCSDPRILCGIIVCYESGMLAPTPKPPRLYIREWMERARINQTQLAERMGCGHGTVSKLLNDRMEITQNWLAAISFALGVSAIDLYRDPSRRDVAAEIETLPPQLQEEALRFVEYLKTRK